MENINRCPNCGGTLELSKNRRSMICPFCDSEFLLNNPSTPSEAGPPSGRPILDDRRYNLLWDYEYLSNYNKDVSASLLSLIHCTDELVSSTAIMDYIRSRLLPNDSELAGDGVNESLLTDLKNRLSRDFLPDEKIMVYGNTAVFSKGKEGMVVTNKRTLFVSKKKVFSLMHKDIHSVKVAIGMKLPSYYLNGKLDFYLMTMGSHFKLQGAMLALALAYAWEMDPNRKRIDFISE